MRNLTFILFVSIVLSCTNQTDKKSINWTVKSDTEVKIDSSIALNFLNGYVDLNNKTLALDDRVNWIANNKLVTDNFKKSFKETMDNVSEDEPLEADPVFNAQDYPDKGFEIINYDKNSGNVTMRGIDWADFKIVVKLIQVDGKTLVDGCGLINTPIDKN